jgi:DNA-binding MarR family transcriptional regulator
LIKIFPDPSDRRSRRLALTPEGQQVLASAVPIWEKMHAEVEAGLDSPAAQLRKSLQQLA